MPFVKGQSGNPAGKPKGAKSFTSKVKEALIKIAEGKDYSYEEALVKSILKKAIIDGDSASQKLIWNYLDGMPTQRQEITGADGKEFGVILLPEKKINEINENSLDTDNQTTASIHLSK